tara:strand:- start:590 stop:868 length:279 start_codon:yes stop_codon:yes gene_type:complete
MRTYFNLDTDRTIRVRDMDATPGTENTWSVGQDCGEKQQIQELAQDLIQMGVTETGYTFSSDLDFPREYGFMADDDAHRIVATALTIAVGGV